MYANTHCTAVNQPDVPTSIASVSFGEAVRVYIRVAVNSFGGPAGQIAVMHRILVEEKRWISEERFLHALNYCMLLPGPEAQQLITYIGWLLHKTRGGLAAGTLFVLPGFLAILLLSLLYAGFQDTSFVQAVFYGLKPAVLAVVVEAVVRIGKRALKTRLMVLISVLAFFAIFFLGVPFPWIVLTAGLVGLVGGWRFKSFFQANFAHTAGSAPAGPYLTDTLPVHTFPSWSYALRTASVWLLVWWIPVGIVALIFGRDSVFVTEGFFFQQNRSGYVWRGLCRPGLHRPAGGRHLRLAPAG